MTWLTVLSKIILDYETYRNTGINVVQKMRTSYLKLRRILFGRYMYIMLLWGKKSLIMRQTFCDPFRQTCSAIQVNYYIINIIAIIAFYNDGVFYTVFAKNNIILRSQRLFDFYYLTYNVTSE